MTSGLVVVEREGGVGQEGRHGEGEGQAVDGLSFKGGEADEGIRWGRVQRLVYAQNVF